MPFQVCEVWEEKGDTHGRPDYTLRINGRTKFFLEAKSPSDQLSSDDIFQTKRYAWNAAGRDVFFAAISDFEHFKLFDASLVPNKKSPLDGEALNLIYNEYAAKIDTLWELSRERVAAGSLDQFLKTDPKALRQRKPLDAAFLDSLTDWRQQLASAIYSRNPDLDVHQLNEVVQRLLDRIIFIRIAEDRKVIERRQLLEVAEDWEQTGSRRNIMDFLLGLFREINENFNGEIFKPHPCEKIKVDSAVLARIIRELYPPEGNYLFNEVPVELLGSVYERYLGSTLATTGKRVSIERKPELRKARGVYYTPQYIVDYIVKGTVGRLIKGKSLRQIEKVHILDPACGSGSFLLGAFQFLIDYYIRYLSENPKEARQDPLFPDITHDEKGELHLSVVRKAEILRNNLYGVDIDPQAVEVTMMSLYLKSIEGERSLLPPKHRLLPPLTGNIRCGNSLIGPDIEKDKALTPEDRRRVSPFDWNSDDNGFGDILKSGGFDAVIGNPPWGGDIDAEIEYFHSQYPATTQDHTDSFKLFIELGLRLVRSGGLVSMIVPNTILRQRRLRDVRRLLFGNSILSVADLGEDVFKGVVAPSCVFVVSKAAPGRREVHLRDLSRVSPAERTKLLLEETTKLDHVVKQRILVDNNELASRKSEIPVQDFVIPLSNVAEFKFKDAGINYQRVHVGMRAKGNSDLAYRLLYEGRQERSVDRMFWKGSDIGRYWIAESTCRFCRPDTKPRKNEVVHLNRDIYNIVPKILLRQTADVIIATMDYSGVWFGRSVISVVKQSGEYKPEYLLGLLNSRYLRNVYEALVHESGRVFAQVKLSNLAQLPFRKINFDDSTDKAMHDRIVHLVQRMQELNKSRGSNAAKVRPAFLEALERQIAETDAEIDNLVYDLYGITDEERKIIEGSTSTR